MNDIKEEIIDYCCICGESLGKEKMLSDPIEERMCDKCLKSSNEPIQLNHWTITSQLRWISRDVIIDVEVSKIEKVLQQLHQSSTGEQKWEDVPIIYEDNLN